MKVLDILIGLFLIIWLGGLFLHIAGTFIYVFLVLAIIVFVLRLLGVKV